MPAGAMIVVIAGAVFLVSAAFKLALQGKKKHLPLPEKIVK
jgi:hypothetical protein